MAVPADDRLGASTLFLKTGAMPRVSVTFDEVGFTIADLTALGAMPIWKPWLSFYRGRLSLSEVFDRRRCLSPEGEKLIAISHALFLTFGLMRYSMRGLPPVSISIGAIQL
jgi:hypothetical protein